MNLSRDWYKNTCLKSHTNEMGFVKLKVCANLELGASIQTIFNYIYELLYLTKLYLIIII